MKGILLYDITIIMISFVSVAWWMILMINKIKKCYYFVKLFKKTTKRTRVFIDYLFSSSLASFLLVFFIWRHTSEQMNVEEEMKRQWQWYYVGVVDRII